jgi:hypothetical protein
MDGQERDAGNPEMAAAQEPGSDTGAPAFAERGRDLLLLALALIMVIEGLFAAVTIAGGHPAPVANIGRFALLAGLSYMTWQGFPVSRWILVLLAGVAALAGPWQVLEAISGGRPVWAAVLACTVAGYAAACWLLAAHRDVADYLAYRRHVRNTDMLR